MKEVGFMEEENMIITHEVCIVYDRAVAEA